MLICPNCGTANTDDSKFCEHCGTKLEGAAQYELEPGLEQWRQETTGQGFDQNFTQNMAAGRGPRKKMSGLQIAVILEAVCLVLLVVAFFAIGNSRGSAIYVAEKYFEAYAAQDWEEAYGMLEIPEGEFIQEDQYEKIMDASSLPEITSFQVQESDGNAGDGIAQTFEVNYSINGQGQSTTTVTVVRQSRKSMLFFDTWKVSADGLIAQNYNIYVPKGAQIAVDGVRLTEEHLVSEEEGQACYQISIFNGVHSIQAEVPWCETYEAQFDTEEQAEYTVSGLTLSEEGVQAVETKLQEVMEACCQAALAGSSFDQVKDLFAEGAPDSNEEYYEDLKDSLEADRYSSVQQLQLSGFECDVFEVGTSNGSIQVELSYDYAVIYTYQGIFDDAPESRTKDGSSYASAQFVYDGDTYRLWSFTPGSIWY